MSAVKVVLSNGAPDEIELGKFGQGVAFRCDAEGGIEIVDVASRKVIARASQTNPGWPTYWRRNGESSSHSHAFVHPAS